MVALAVVSSLNRFKQALAHGDGYVYTKKFIVQGSSNGHFDKRLPLDVEVKIHLTRQSPPSESTSTEATSGLFLIRIELNLLISLMFYWKYQCLLTAV